MNISAAKSKANLRRKARYAVSENCRLRSSIAFVGGSGGSSDAPRKDWSGALVDLSANGAHIQVSLAAVASAGDGCVLKLGYGTVKIEIRATVAHYVCGARHSVCGVNFEYLSAGVEKTYQRVLGVIIASASLAAGPAGTDSSGRHREEYRGVDSARLLVWRERLGGPVVGFDFTMSRYAALLPEAEGDPARMKELVRFKPISTAESGDSPSFLSRTQEADARWELGLAASNLPAAVPAEVRKFLLAMA